MVRSCRKVTLKDECAFLSKLITSVKSIIQESVRGNNASGNVGNGDRQKTAAARLEYKTDAVGENVIKLTPYGFVAYIYVKAYGVPIPDKPNAAETKRIHEIYNALKIPIPR